MATDEPQLLDMDELEKLRRKAQDRGISMTEAVLRFHAEDNGVVDEPAETIARKGGPR
jgi:DUF1365 family protein